MKLRPFRYKPIDVCISADVTTNIYDVGRFVYVLNHFVRCFVSLVSFVRLAALLALRAVASSLLYCCCCCCCWLLLLLLNWRRNTVCFVFYFLSSLLLLLVCFIFIIQQSSLILRSGASGSGIRANRINERRFYRIALVYLFLIIFSLCCILLSTLYCCEIFETIETMKLVLFLRSPICSSSLLFVDFIFGHYIVCGCAAEPWLLLRQCIGSSPR